MPADADRRNIERAFEAFNDHDVEAIRGEFMGIAATSREIDIEAVDFLHFDEDGRATAHWGCVNQLDLLQQLGAAPAPPA